VKKKIKYEETVSAELGRKIIKRMVENAGLKIRSVREEIGV